MNKSEVNVIMKKNRTTGEKKVQTGLRIPESRYKKIKEISERTGISINSVTVMMIDLGLNLYEKDSSDG